MNGLRLHYASVGQGPLVLFLHGYPSFWYQWKDQMAEMGRDHRAIGLDMRGYNLSSRPEGVEPYNRRYSRRYLSFLHWSPVQFRCLRITRGR